MYFCRTIINYIMNSATTQPTLHHPVHRAMAQVVSVIFHPLFLPVLLVLLLLNYHTETRFAMSGALRVRFLAMVFINTVLFPGLVVFLLWRLGFVKSLQLHTTRERIIPLVVGLIFYFWAWHVARNLDYVTNILEVWLLGVFASSCAAMFCNIFFKISLHTLGAGSLAAFHLCAALHYEDWAFTYLFASVLVAGLVGTARLIRQAHEPGEVYAGYLAGAICQVVAWWIVY